MVCHSVSWSSGLVGYSSTDDPNYLKIKQKDKYIKKLTLDNDFLR